MIQQSEDLLVDARTKLESSKNISVPITELAILGAAITSLIPVLKTLNAPAAIDVQGLFTVANLGPTGFLEMAKDKTYWPYVKTPGGTSSLGKLLPVGSLGMNPNPAAAINPALIMLAVALISIERQIKKIMSMQKKLVQMMEFEKESAVEADVEQLISIIIKYKNNWDNDQFITTNHKMVNDIQRTARAHMISYQKEIDTMLDKKKGIVIQKHVKDKLNELLKKFKYYRLCNAPQKLDQK